MCFTASRLTSGLLSLSRRAMSSSKTSEHIDPLRWNEEWNFRDFCVFVYIYISHNCNPLVRAFQWEYTMMKHYGSRMPSGGKIILDLLNMKMMVSRSLQEAVVLKKNAWMDMDWQYRALGNFEEPGPSLDLKEISSIQFPAPRDTVHGSEMRDPKTSWGW